MKLKYRQFSDDGEPLIILHGLYGNQANWAGIARKLADHFCVYTFDARNHGQSGWANRMHLKEMAADVAETTREIGFTSAHFIGHSMGGKTAMLLALQAPEWVRSLTVVDIAPVDYHRDRDEVLQGMLDLRLHNLRNRAEADEQMAVSIPDKAVRDFLIANLQRSAEDGFQWRINLPVIRDSFRELTGWPKVEGSFEGPTLFIKGAKSDYIQPGHEKQIRLLFPKAHIATVADAGHWVHAEKPEEVLALLRDFLPGA